MNILKKKIISTQQKNPNNNLKIGNLYLSNKIQKIHTSTSNKDMYAFLFSNKLFNVSTIQTIGNKFTYLFLGIDMSYLFWYCLTTKEYLCIPETTLLYYTFYEL